MNSVQYTISMYSIRRNLFRETKKEIVDQTVTFIVPYYCNYVGTRMQKNEWPRKSAFSTYYAARKLYLFS